EAVAAFNKFDRYGFRVVCFIRQPSGVGAEGGNGGDEKIAEDDYERKEDRALMSGFQKKRHAELRSMASVSHNWNTFFVSTDAVVTYMSDRFVFLKKGWESKNIWEVGRRDTCAVALGAEPRKTGTARKTPSSICVSCCSFHFSKGDFLVRNCGVRIGVELGWFSKARKVTFFSDGRSFFQEQLLDATGKESAAVRIAHGEVQLVHEIRDYLQRQGVCLDLLIPASALQGRRDKVESRAASMHRQVSSSVFLIKNLPVGRTEEDVSKILHRLTRKGTRSLDAPRRIVVPPLGITAIVGYAMPQIALLA
ncbi:unnamed protein product, partial [Taenia asiatica]|uniref:Zeta_toxin domain-containing protein n=1 Tax=Taenia asiatica TaxID=60517 RepID=A0A0R3VZB9_TAEAS